MMLTRKATKGTTKVQMATFDYETALTWSAYAIQARRTLCNYVSQFFSNAVAKAMSQHSIDTVERGVKARRALKYASYNVKTTKILHAK